MSMSSSTDPAQNDPSMLTVSAAPTTTSFIKRIWGIITSTLLWPFRYDGATTQSNVSGVLDQTQAGGFKRVKAGSSWVSDSSMPSDVSHLSSSELQQFIDNLQEELLPSDARPSDLNPKQQIQQLLALISKCHLYPSQLTLQEDVRCNDRRIYGMGRVADVYKGEYHGESVAMKHLRAFNMVQPSQRTGLVKAFRYESVRWFNLRHQNVLPFFGVIDAAELGGLCMVSPWCDHGTIRQYLVRMVQDGISGPALVAMLNRSLGDIANGLAYLHKEDIVHGDLRGSNILIYGNERICIADPGVVQITEQARDYPNLDQGGTAAWQAPELIEPESFGLPASIPSKASDVYAFACLCIELYTRQNPFPNQREIKIVTKVLKGQRPERPLVLGEEMPEDIWKLVNRAWTSNPKSRTSSDDIAAFFLARD